MTEDKNGKNSSIPRGYLAEDTKARLEWVKKFTGIEIDNSILDKEEDLQGIIENHVGFMKIPMAVVGPMTLNGTYARGEFCVPVCTLEGTLAMSMNRGMVASSLSGGTHVKHFRQELSRAPVFIFNSLEESAQFQTWVNKNKDKIAAAAESTTKHGMVTLAAKVACELIREETGHSYFLESNINSDKKASVRNMLLGRGHGVTAETTIKNSVMKKVLKVDPDILFDNWAYYPVFSSMVGTHGVAIHESNALTAIYLATGQDAACVAENSIAHFDMEKKEDALKFKLTLPSLTVGTVGGGTRLQMQRKNLEMLGCADGENSSKKLAEIIAGATLALDISLVCAIGSHTFTDAHMKYGRK